MTGAMVNTGLNEMIIIGDTLMLKVCFVVSIARTFCLGTLEQGMMYSAGYD